MLALLLPLLVSPAMGQVMEGLVHLDKYSIDKMLGVFEWSLVKFDVGYPTGEAHKGFGGLGRQVAGEANLLAAEVRIKDYGDKANQDVAARFGVRVEKEGLPETLLFARDQEGRVREAARYGGDYSLGSLRRFLASKTGVLVHLEGCIRELDLLVERYSKAATREEREKILFSAESWAKEKEEEDTAKVYVKMMAAGLASPQEGAGAVEREVARVSNILQDKASAGVRERMARRLNVLSTFSLYSPAPPREEL